MGNVETKVDLTRKLQAVEQDRIELVQQAVEVLRSIQTGNQVELTEALAGVVGLAYLLGTQMGITPHRVDRDVIQVLQSAAETDLLRGAEMTEVARYLRDRA